MVPKMKKENWKSLLISISISLGVGIVSSVLNMGGMSAYSEMFRPPLAPPAWLFPVVWTILYLLMGIAAWLVWETGVRDGKETEEEVQLGLTLYATQLMLNFIWPFLFFRLEAYFLALADLLLLWLAVYLTIKQFAKVNRIAAALLIPYLAWLTFAGYLNLAIAIHYE